MNQDSTQLARAVVTCQNIKCLLIQLLIEVLCLCETRRKASKKDDTAMKDDNNLIKNPLSIDYTRVFQGMLSQEGQLFEHEIVSFIHSILVQEPMVID